MTNSTKGQIYMSQKCGRFNLLWDIFDIDKGDHSAIDRYEQDVWLHLSLLTLKRAATNFPVIILWLHNIYLSAILKHIWFDSFVFRFSFHNICIELFVVCILLVFACWWIRLYLLHWGVGHHSVWIPPTLLFASLQKSLFRHKKSQTTKSTQLQKITLAH